MSKQAKVWFSSPACSQETRQAGLSDIGSQHHGNTYTRILMMAHSGIQSASQSDLLLLQKHGGEEASQKSERGRGADRQTK
jgi:hypothetical protein